MEGEGILLVGHGPLPEAMKESLSMITGDVSRVCTVCLRPDEGKEDLERKMRAASEELSSCSRVLVFADLLGGSPANAAMVTFLPDEKYELVSGMNLPMLLVANMATGMALTDLLREGRNGIGSLRGEKNPVTRPTPAVSCRDTSRDDVPKQICNVRLDSRGIHGQVATAWVPRLGVNRIMVVDDLAIKDEMQKMALKMAKPSQAKLSILSARKAAERLLDEQAYRGEKILVVLLRVETLVQLAEQGCVFPEVNLGNIPTRPGTQKYRKTIALLPEEARLMTQMKKQGTHFTAQMVPGDEKTDFDVDIKEG